MIIAHLFAVVVSVRFPLRTVTVQYCNSVNSLWQADLRAFCPVATMTHKSGRQVAGKYGLELEKKKIQRCSSLSKNELLPITQSSVVPVIQEATTPSLFWAEDRLAPQAHEEKIVVMMVWEGWQYDFSFLVEGTNDVMRLDSLAFALWASDPIEPPKRKFP